MQDEPVDTRSSLQTFENSLLLLSTGRAPGAVVLLLTALESLLKQIPQLEANQKTDVSTVIKKFEAHHRNRFIQKSLILKKGKQYESWINTAKVGKEKGFRELRNEYVHKGSSPEDDAKALAYFARIGLPYFCLAVSLANKDKAPKTDRELFHHQRLQKSFGRHENIAEYSVFGVWFGTNSIWCFGYTSYVNHLIWALQTVEQLPLPNKDDEVPLESGKALWGIRHYVHWRLRPIPGHQVDAEQTIHFDDEAIWDNFYAWAPKYIRGWQREAYDGCLFLKVDCPICGNLSLLMIDHEILDVDDCSEIKLRHFSCPECYCETDYSPLLGNIFTEMWEEDHISLIDEYNDEENLPESSSEKLEQLKKAMKEMQG